LNGKDQNGNSAIKLRINIKGPERPTGKTGKRREIYNKEKDLSKDSWLGAKGSKFQRLQGRGAPKSRIEKGVGLTVTMNFVIRGGKKREPSERGSAR